MFEVAKSSKLLKIFKNAYPNEACIGIDRKSRIKEIENISPNPQQHFLANVDLTQFRTLIHSHTASPPMPSEQDIKVDLILNATRHKTDLGIADLRNPENHIKVYWYSTLNLLEADLLGRMYLNYVFDCYSLIRAYFWQEKKVYLKNFMRIDDWWKDAPASIIVSNFEQAGFIKIKEEEAKEGDCCILRIGSNVENHCAVYFGNGEILHQLYNQKSTITSIQRWRKYITHWVRYII